MMVSTLILVPECVRLEYDCVENREGGGQCGPRMTRNNDVSPIRHDIWTLVNNCPIVGVRLQLVWAISPGDLTLGVTIRAKHLFQRHSPYRVQECAERR